MMAAPAFVSSGRQSESPCRGSLVTRHILDGIPKTLLHNHNDGMLDVLYGDNPAAEDPGLRLFDLALIPATKPEGRSVSRPGWVREYPFHGQIENSLVTYLSRGVLDTIDGGSHHGRSGTVTPLAASSAPDELARRHLEAVVPLG